MSIEENKSLWYRSYVPYLAIGGAIVLIGIGVLVARKGPNPPSPVIVERKTVSSEDPLVFVRDNFAQSTNLEVCRQAIQKMNAYVRQASVPTAQLTTSDSQRDFLQKHYALSPEEMAEINSSSFTTLDAHHLDLCFLLRDAVRSLSGQDESPTTSVRPTEQQVADAFDWVIRQVLLHVYAADPDPLPPQFVLRRGTGSALERALVFQAMLHQLGMQGCLVTVPGKSGQELWACGVVVDRDDGKQLILFDPRLGLALPGEGGAGVATLSEIRSRPDLLKQLTVDSNLPYDVTAEQISKAELLIVCPLSALAQRMVFLQNKLRDLDASIKAPPIQVQLAADAAALLRNLEVAAPGIPVKVESDLARVLRAFLPVEQGGIDRTNRLTIFQSELIPWNLLPQEVRDLKGEPGQILQNIFGMPFVQLMVEPGKPHDLVLRGEFAAASKELVDGIDSVRAQKAASALPADWQEHFSRWQKEIYAAQANLNRRQVDAGQKDAGDAQAMKEAQDQVMAVWEKGKKVVIVPLILGRKAEPHLLRLTYLLALCMHEQAEQHQARLDRMLQQGREAGARRSEEKAARDAWKTAAHWWESLADDRSGLDLAGARRLHARARVMLGQPERAVALLEEVSPGMTDWDKTAHAYLAAQVKTKRAQ